MLAVYMIVLQGAMFSQHKPKNKTLHFICNVINNTIIHAVLCKICYNYDGEPCVLDSWQTNEDMFVSNCKSTDMLMFIAS